MFNIYGLTVEDCLFILTNPDTSTNWSSAAKMLGQFFFLVLGFIIIIVLAVFSLKLAANLKNIGGLNNNMRVIESRSLGFNNYIHLVKAGDKYFIVGSSKTNVTYLTEIEGDAISDYYETPTKVPFESMFKSGIDKIKNKNNKPMQ